LDRATRAGTFKYDITVLPPASTNQGRPITTDPGYINEI
jgi:hypothetical protein